MTSQEFYDARTTQWQRIRGKLRSEFGDGVFRSWLKPMTLSEIDGESVTIAVPTRFMRDRVNALYGDRLRALWSAEDVGSVNVIVCSGVSSQPVVNGRNRTADADCATGGRVMGR